MTSIKVAMIICLVSLVCDATYRSVLLPLSRWSFSQLSAPVACSFIKRFQKVENCQKGSYQLSVGLKNSLRMCLGAETSGLSGLTALILAALGVKFYLKRSVKLVLIFMAAGMVWIGTVNSLRLWFLLSIVDPNRGKLLSDFFSTTFYFAGLAGLLIHVGRKTHLQGLRTPSTP